MNQPIGADESASRSTARGALLLLVGRIVFMVSGYLITVILARELGPAAYGVYGIVMSVLLWLEVSGDAGISRTAIKLIPQSAQPDVLAGVVTSLLLIVSLALFLVCWIAAPWVTNALHLDDDNGTLLFRLAILDLPFNGLYLAYQGVLQGRRQFKTLSVTVTLYSLAKLGGTVLLVFLGMSVEAALIVNVLATVVALIFLINRYPCRIGLPNLSMVGGILQISVPLGISIVCSQLLLSAHLWSLQRHGSVTEEIVGQYVAAFNLARLPTVIPFVLTGVLLASMSTALARQNDELASHYLKAAGRFMLIVLLPVCVLGALDATPIMRFVFSDAYFDGGPLLAILLVAFGLWCVLDVLLHSMVADGRQIYIMIGLLVLLPIAMVLNALLIPLYGAIGAAMALALTLCIANAVVILWTISRYGPPVDTRTLFRVAFSVAIAALVSMQVSASGMMLVLKLIGMLAIYAAALVLLRELGRRDFELLELWKK